MENEKPIDNKMSNALKKYEASMDKLKYTDDINSHFQGPKADIIFIDEAETIDGLLKHSPVVQPRCVKCGWRKPIKIGKEGPICTVCMPKTSTRQNIKKDLRLEQRKIKNDKNRSKQPI